MTLEWRSVSIDGETWPYEISNWGRIRRSKTGGRGGPAIGNPLSERLVGGYNQVALYRDGERKHVYVHGLVAVAFLGPRPDGYEVNHKDRNKLNNHIENLEFVTHKQNSLRGSEHPKAKLVESDVVDIRKRVDAILNEYDISVWTLAAIARRENWRHI